MLFFMSRMTS